MRVFSIFICLLLSHIVISGCGKTIDRSEAGSSADWAFAFVVWNGDIYHILDAEVNPEDIDVQLGEVIHYSDVEGTYEDGFSNRYPAGTKLYKIKDIKTSEHIAIQEEEGLFIKAKNNGKYGGR